jgi:hypothetical protein
VDIRITKRVIFDEIRNDTFYTDKEGRYLVSYKINQKVLEALRELYDN